MGIVKDSLIGLAIGDAMGVPVKNVDRDKLIDNPITSMTGYGTYDLEEGTWSDNTSMTLGTIDSIMKTRKIDVNDIANRFINWINSSEYTATGKVFDIDEVTKNALLRYASSHDASTSGLNDFNDNSNGSLTRMLPIALYCHYNKLNNDEIFNIVKKASSITHANDISILGCYIYVNYMMFILNGKDKFASLNMIRLLDYSEYFDEDTIAYYNRILKANINKLRVADVKSDSFIVHTLETVLWLVLNCRSYAETIVGAINMGGDTDTIAAISGSIAGTIYGYESIPEIWLSKLKRVDYLEEIADNFEATLM